jgi:hypothetical protein
LIDPVLGKSYEAVVNLPSNIPDLPEVEASVSSWKGIDGLLQPSLQPEELLWAEEVCKKDAKVKAACDAVGIAQDSIAVDGTFISLHSSMWNGADTQRMVYRKRRAISWSKIAAMFRLCQTPS